MFKGAIFDLDGVIVNTVPLHFKAWKKMFAEYGRDFSFQDYVQKVDGISRIAGARAILVDLSDAELERASQRKQKYFLEFLAQEGVEVYQSTIMLIKILRSKGIKLAAISSSKNCLYILKQARAASLFDAVISTHDIKKGKPEPDIFLLAAGKLDLEPAECLVFEDALLGVEAAKRAQMKCIGIDRYQHAARLAKADRVVSDLSEISFTELCKTFNQES